jgi:hypothetical protein
MAQNRFPGPFADMCAWPECDGEIGEVDAPLCTRHLTKAYRIYRTSHLWAFDHATDHAMSAALERTGRPKLKRARQTDGVVYFVRFGGLVKIGWTSNLKRRMSDVPNEEILGTTAGTMEDEKRCHAAFAHLRVKGEWFTPEPDLMAFISDVTAA